MAWAFLGMSLYLMVVEAWLIKYGTGPWLLNTETGELSKIKTVEYSCDNIVTDDPLPTKPPLGGYQPVSSNIDTNNPPTGGSGVYTPPKEIVIRYIVKDGVDE